MKTPSERIHPTDVELRRRAESAVSSNSQQSLTPEATAALLYELRVHQIELEMQNEELRRTQLELEVSRSRYFDLYDCAPVGYCTISEQGKILEINLTLATLLGESRDRLIDRPISRFIAVEDADLFHVLKKRLCLSAANTEQAELANKPSVCELRLTKAGGSEFWTQLVITVVPRSDSANSGAPVDRGGRTGECALRIAVNDISNRKAVEAEKDLLEIKLRESQKLDAVGRLTGGIAHDFNNILQVICGYTKMVLRNKSLDQRAKNDLQRVDDSAQRAADLVKRLIGFARQNTLQLEAFPINQAIEQLLELIRRVTEERIVLEVDSCPGDPRILADRGLFEQLLMNLCINARDSIPGSGKIVIHTRMLCESDNLGEKPDGCDAKNYVVMTVADTGCGMDEETRNRCIEPFFSKKGFEGHSGLGLAMVHGIIRQHNGWMQIESASGEGSQFRLYWPAIDSIGSKPVLPEHPEQEDTYNGTETILLAEDDEGVREMTATILTEAGYSVFKAKNGTEAVALFRQYRETIHMLLFDMIMPAQGGFEAYSEIEALSPGIKVLFVTGHQENLGNAKTLQRKNLSVVSKPLMPDDLLRKLRTVLDSTRNAST